MNKKLTKIIMYIIGTIFFIVAIVLITVGASIGDTLMKNIGIGISFASLPFILIGFLIDFIDTMVINETAGDQFTIMTKDKLISLLDEHNIEYEEGKGREYYLYIVRENFVSK